VELRPALNEKIERLTEQGVCFPNPLTVDLGDEVDVGRVSGTGVTVFPGCRIYGERTVISAGAQIGREGPATIEDCQLGPKVELKAGFFSRSVFPSSRAWGLGRRCARRASWRSKPAGRTASG
jgi:UDP-N-acetylglucosamine/UDP-N-acetylgalactosamine diphosphorylase